MGRRTYTRKHGASAGETGDGTVSGAAAAPARDDTEKEHAGDQQPRGVAQDGAEDLVDGSRLELARPHGAGEHAEGEQREACDQEPMRRLVERLEGRQPRALAEQQRLLVLQATLLHEVHDGRRASEQEEGVTHEVGEDVKADEARRQLLIRGSAAEEEGAQRHHQAERSDHQADGVDPKTAPGDEVDRGGDERGDGENEVHRVDGADPRDEARDDHVGAVHRARPRQEPRRDGPLALLAATTSRDLQVVEGARDAVEHDGASEGDQSPRG